MQATTTPTPESFPVASDADADAGFAPNGSLASAHAPQTVLIVHDGGSQWDRVPRLLGPAINVVAAHSGAEALEKARVLQPDLVLLDLLLPDMTGFEVLRRLKADVRTTDIAAIFVTGKDYAGDGIRSVLLGAADYLTTPFDPAVLGARCAAHLRLAAYRRQVDDLTQLDVLTGVYNRRHFDGMLALESRRAQRAQTQLTVGMVDVDFFPQYNDYYGRSKGDDVLRAVAQALRTGIRRPADLAARYFGETFALVIPETGPVNALKVMQSLCQSVAALQIPHAASKAGSAVTVSIGLATTEVGEDGEGEGVVKRADLHLQQAKAAGRNRVIGEV